MSDDAKLPPVGRFNRFRKMASVSARLGTDVLTRGVKRLAGQEAALMTRGTAEKLVSTLGDLKGAAMKIGQMMSMDSELVSPEIRGILAKLQNEAPAMPYHSVREIIEEELGAPPEIIFKSFEPVPMAAASLGQVHRAELHDGRQVVVKVQYPGIGEALVSDLDNLGSLVKVLGKTSNALDGRAYYEELRDQMVLEVDYRREASLAQAFAVAARPLPDLRVPEVYEGFTSNRVLTLEFLNGKTLKDFLVSEPTAPERFRVSRLLIRAIYGPFLTEGEMHADPHPGNFLVLPDGRLGVLDFGSIKRFSPNFLEVQRGMFQQAVHQSPLDVLAILRKVGFSIDLPDDEAVSLATAVLHVAGRPLHEDHYDYSQDKTTSEMKALFTQHASRFLKLRPPSEAVMFFRSTGGLSQNLRLLGASGDFRGIYRELSALIPAA